MNPVFKNVQRIERIRNRMERKVAVDDDEKKDLVMMDQQNEREGTRRVK